MKHFLLSFSFISSFVVFGQITVDQNDFPSADDTALVSVSDELVLDIVTTGPNSVWDYSTLHISEQRIDTFHDVSDASFTYQLVFNNVFTDPEHLSDYSLPLVGFDLSGLSGLGIPIDNVESFVQVSSSSVENVGLGFEVSGFGIPFGSDTIDTEFELPMNYNDSWTSNSYTNMDLSPSGYDIIFRRYQYRNSTVDGWGSITTLFGTFDVLRVKSNLSFIDSAYIGLFGSWIELPTPAQVEYTWWSNNNKEPILRVTTQDVAGTETVTRVEFKDMERNIAAIETNLEFQGSIYPNPATSSVNFTFEQGVNQIEIYSISGELVYQNTITNSTLNIDVANWTSGVYMVKLIGDETVSSTKLVVE